MKNSKDLQKIKGDASFRTFYRSKKNNSIVVYAKKEKFFHIETNEELLKYKIASVGSYDTNRGTWQWTWGKQDLSEEDRILLVRQISILAASFPDNKDLFNSRPMKKDEFYGQEIAGALVKLLEGEAIYNASYDEDSEYWLYLVLIEQIKQ